MKRGPRINQADFKALYSSHIKLDQIIRLCRGTNWAGAPACIILAGEVDTWVAEMYNRAESAFLGAPEAASAPSESSPSPELAPARDPEGPRPPDPAVLEEEKIQKCIHGLSVDQDCGLCRIGNT